MTTIELISEGCNCCTDLPGYLSCNEGGTARCTECGWSQDFPYLEDAPEACPDCAGGE